MEFLGNIAAYIDNDTLWLVQVFTVVFLTVLADFIATRLISKLDYHTQASHNMWDDALFHALRRPARMLIWVLGLIFATEIAFEDHKEETFFALLYSVREVAVIVAMTWFGLRFISSVEENILLAAEEGITSLDRTTANAIAKLMRITITITGILIGMQALGFSVTGVMAAGGVGGLAIGFAAKDLLANFFGALMIYLDRPFAVGDWIRSPDKEIEGTVEEIGWRLTRIRTFDKRPLYVPNSVFNTISIQNPSRMTHRRINEIIGVRYDDMGSVDKITRDVEKMLGKHKEIDAKQTLMVHVNAFGPSSVDFFIYTFTKTTNWEKYHAIKQDVLLKIAAIIEKHGAEIAFPTQTLHIESPELAGLVAGKK